MEQLLGAGTVGGSLAHPVAGVHSRTWILTHAAMLHTG